MVVMYEIIKKKDLMLSLFLALNVLFIFLSNALFVLGPVMENVYTLFSMVSKVFMFVFFVYLFIRYRNFIKLDTLLIFLLLLLFFLFNYLLFPELNEFQKNTITVFCVMCLPNFVCMRLLSNYTMLFEKMRVISFIVSFLLLFFLIAYFLKLINPYQISAYFMGFGYSCTIPAVIVFADFIFSGRKKSIVFFAIDVSVILLFGSRGSFLGVVLCCLLLTLFQWKPNKRYSVLNVVKILLLLFVAFLLFFGAAGLQRKIQNFSVESRTIRLLVYENDLSHDSGRSELQKPLLDAFSENYISVRGLNAEYPVIGIYAHNLWVELFFQYGIFLGGFFLVFIMAKMICSVKNYDRTQETVLSVIFGVLSVCMLFFSSSLWISQTFWLWMGSPFLTGSNAMWKYVAGDQING